MCPVDRENGEKGICGQNGQIKAARAALHYWEEPCISGKAGSGTVFFSGCPLHCVYCQNRNIANGSAGKYISIERLSDIFLELQEKGANNVNLVTPGHFVPQIIKALNRSKLLGLTLPIVYNTGSYETVDTIKMLQGIVDIYLPDFKYMDTLLAERYSYAPDYADTAKQAIAEMVRQTGPAQFHEDGGESLMTRGTIIRHLILPGHTKDSKEIIRYLYETYGDTVYLSILNQFTPVPENNAAPELCRRLTEEEYDEVVDYALSLGVEHGFIQEGGTAAESFIPEFDCEGV